MKVLLALILSAAVGYLFGSLNFAIMIVKIMTGKDIRTMGSKNAGLTNTYRCCGVAPAILTLIGDLCKGVVAVGVSRWIAYALGAGLSPDNDTHYIGYIAAMAAVIGHIFPIYFRFKGGKGVLVGVSSFLMVDPKVFFALIAIFIVMLSLSKYVSLSSIIASAYCPIATLLMSWIVNGETIGRSLLYMLMSMPIAGLVIFMHRSNIERLKNNTESKFRFKKA